MITRCLRAGSTVLRNLCTPPGIVLLYHRVAAPCNDLHRLAVSPHRFRRQMELVKKHFAIVRFEDDWTRISRPWVAVTFDDGYRDNLTHALPILEELGIPATFFICAGALDSDKPFWWDELGMLLRTVRREHLAPILDQFGLYRPLDPQIWPDRETLAGVVHPLVKAMDGARRAQLLAEMRAGHPTRGDHGRPITQTELLQLSQSPLVTIGAHTMSHAALAFRTPSEQEEDIRESRRLLSRLLNKPIDCFSYPFGHYGDYSETTANLCRALGFRKVAANIPGQVRPETDLFQIPRRVIRDWPGGVFFFELLKAFWT